MKIEIKDNGAGIEKSLLKKDENGVKVIFKENSTTKKKSANSGYGCYIAYENCKRCGWLLDAENHINGAIIKITIPVEQV